MNINTLPSQTTPSPSSLISSSQTTTRPASPQRKSIPQSVVETKAESIKNTNPKERYAGLVQYDTNQPAPAITCIYCGNIVRNALAPDPPSAHESCAKMVRIKEDMVGDGSSVYDSRGFPRVCIFKD